MTVQSLLPPNGTPFLRAFEAAVAFEPRLEGGVDLIPDIKGRHLPTWLKFLLYDYGLIELTNYVPNAYTLLGEGRPWQIERDTFAAVARGLGWLSVTGQIDEAPSRRNWWNSFQLFLSALPPADAPDLDRIEGVVRLSKPFRSDFRRGVYGYDAPAFEGDATRLDHSLLDRESGVRLRANGPLWSFGRPHELTHILDEDEGTELGIWIEHIINQGYRLDFIAGTAFVDDVASTIAAATDFTRASSKLAETLSGSWTRFSPDVMAITNKGLSLEPEATRLSAFWLDDNPLDDDAEALVIATAVADPLGGTQAIQLEFSNTARHFYVPADGLLPETEYAVSFFARKVSLTGSLAGAGDGLLVDIASQLVSGQWVRVKATFTTPADLDGQWLDLSLYAPGAVLRVDLFGFQIEAGAVVTSPIEGNLINGTRAADELILHLTEEGTSDMMATFDDGSTQGLLGLSGDTLIDPSTLNRTYVQLIGNLEVGTWDSMTFPWESADFPWNGDAVTTRAITLAGFFASPERGAAYFRLKDAESNVIGYRRARAMRQVTPSYGGAFTFAGSGYEADDAGVSVFIEAMTDAGNGVGETVGSAEVVIDGDLAPGVPEGRLWLAPGELTGGTAIGPVALSLPLRATVRERLKLMLRF